MRFVFSAIILAGVIQTSCPPPVPPLDPPDVTSPDASAPSEGGPEASTLDAPNRGDLYDVACKAMRDAGCPEGVYTQCAEIMRLAAARRLVDFNTKCVAQCKTRVCVRMCSRDIKCLE